jgi:hypothetical protein
LPLRLNASPHSGHSKVMVRLCSRTCRRKFSAHEKVRPAQPWSKH